MEDGSRRNILRFDGLTEDPNRTWDSCERKVQETLFNDLNIERNIEFDQCHSLRSVEDLAYARFFADFSISKKNKRILQNVKKLKDTEYIYENFCSNAMKLWKLLWEKVLEYRRQGKYVYLNNRNIAVRNNLRYFL